jgi:hypothetical protein
VAKLRKCWERRPVASRLARARQRLHQRLTRRGIIVPAAVLIVLLEFVVSPAPVVPDPRVFRIQLNSLVQIGEGLVVLVEVRVRVAPVVPGRRVLGFQLD